MDTELVKKVGTDTGVKKLSIKDAAKAIVDKANELHGNANKGGEDKKKEEEVVEETGKETADDKTKTIKVRLDDGDEVELPYEQAQKIIKARDARTKELKELRERETARTKKEQEALDAEKSQKDDELAKRRMERGEYAEALNDMKTKLSEERSKDQVRLNKLSENMVASDIKVRLAEAASLNLSDKAHSTLLNDAIRNMRGSLKYDFDAGKVVVINDSGDPMLDAETGQDLGLEKFIKSYVDERPWMVQKKVAKGIAMGGDKDKVELQQRQVETKNQPKTMKDAVKHIFKITNPQAK